MTNFLFPLNRFGVNMRCEKRTKKNQVPPEEQIENQRRREDEAKVVKDITTGVEFELIQYLLWVWYLRGRGNVGSYLLSTLVLT